MKKKIAILAAAALVMSILSACGKDAVYLKEIDASEYVTLGEYKGIEVNEKEPEVPDEVVDYYIKTYILVPRAVTTEVTDRTVVEEGDTVNIDYIGYRDGTPFENGSAQGDSLTIGSGDFIPGFEDGLIGTNIGDTVTLDLTFPDDYGNTEMAGVEVSFEVTINGISIVDIPELTDEIVQETGIEGCSTPDELWDYFYETIYNRNMDIYNQEVRREIISAVTAKCIFKEPPEKMVDRFYDMLVDELTAQAASYGMSFDEETYKEELSEYAIQSAQRYIMFQAISDAEGLNMSEEEINQAMKESAADSGYTSVEEFLEETGEDTFRENIMANKVVDFLIENAVFPN